MAASARGPNLGHLMKTGQYSDMTLVCQGKEFKVHRAVVCSQSEVFAAAIREPFQESKTGIITIEEFDAATVENMLEFLYTGDYGSLADETDEEDNSYLTCRAAPEDTDEEDNSSLTSRAAPEEDLLQHVYVNSIADYYNVKTLANLTRAKLRDALQNQSNAMLVLDAAKEALSRTGDTTLHDMLADAAANNTKLYLETDQLAELIGRFGIGILRRVIDVEEELRLKILVLQEERGSEEDHRKRAEARSAKIIENINDCADTLKERDECRNCRAGFNCYIEQRGQPFEPLFSLRCARCQCRQR